MLEQAISEIHRFYQNAFKKLSDFAAQHPDDPILEEDDGQNLPIDMLLSSSSGVRTFVSSKFPELKYRIDISIFDIKEIAIELAFPRNLAGELVAQSICLNRTGLCFYGRRKWFVHGHNGWTAISESLPDNFMLEGEEANRCWTEFNILAKDIQAVICFIALERNPALLYAIRNHDPGIIKHPLIKEALSKLVIQNRLPPQKKKSGDIPHITPNILNLYRIVYIHRALGVPFERACQKAVLDHPELVPKDWTDAEQTLKKRVQRLDRYENVSLKRLLPRRSGQD